MASPLDQARLFLTKAHDDHAAFCLLCSNQTIADEIVGFHAQQVIEKVLKAVLSFNGLSYRKTHDLAELIDLLNDNQIAFPSFLEQAVDLTPFAVELRYDLLPAEEGQNEQLDRIRLSQLVRQSIEWASTIIPQS